MPFSISKNVAKIRPYLTYFLMRSDAISFKNNLISISIKNKNHDELKMKINFCKYMIFSL